MSVKFRLVKRNNLGKDKDVTPEKIYAQPVYTDKISFDYLLSEISEAGIPSNQVKGVIDRMNYLIRKHLSVGHIVQFGEFGNFRYSVGSTGSETEDDFLTSQIKQPKIIFTPGATLRNAKKATDFKREEPRVVSEDCGRVHLD